LYEDVPALGYTERNGGTETAIHQPGKVLNPMILVTGAAGKTGQEVVRRIAEAGEPVRAMVFRPGQVDGIIGLGAHEVLVGDLRDETSLMKSLDGVRAVYHICPNVHPREVEIGKAIISGALGAGVVHFVFHSVLYPDVEAMPHHWLKFRVEQKLKESGLPFTILRPCAYMQNLLPQITRMARNGKLEVPYDVEAKLSVVDLRDVAAAAAKVLSEPGHEGNTYELCGPAQISHRRMAWEWESVLGRPVEAVAIDPAEWERHARSSGLGDYAIGALLKMFDWYDRNGFVGSPSDLERLLGRSAGSFAEFTRRAAGGS
jgi:NAD(P)H dehydrogenase (quinone)